MKIALVHDYLREYGGAERVVEALHEMWPEAPLYTAFVDWEALGEFGKRFKDWDIRTSWVQKNWLVKKYHSPLRFLTPLVWESLDLRGYDVVISSSGWYICRGVVTRPETLHISYIHHPPRHLYGFPTGSAPNPFIRVYATIVNPFLRLYDFTTAQRVDYLVANSETTRQRIKKFYRREATVIYPPVNVIRETKHVIRDHISHITSHMSPGYFLSVGRLNYAKRVDLAISACNELKLPLKVVGAGKEEAALRKIAGPTIEFLGAVTDQKLSELYRQSRGLIFCALEEDFGMVPVEAMVYGVPVIALRQGGVRETVIDGKTGVFFDEVTVASLTKAIKQHNRLTISPQACIKQAEKFSKAAFIKKMGSFVEEKLQLRD